MTYSEQNQPKNQPKLSARKAVQQHIENLNRQHAVIMLGGRCLILNQIHDPTFNRPDITFSSVQDFKNFYANKRVSIQSDDKSKKLVSLAKLWLESSKRKQYQGLCFNPGQHPPNGFYNLWRGFAVQPKAGDCSLWKELLWEVGCCGSEVLYDWVMDWYADLLQNSGGERSGTSLVFIGPRGTGKGTLQAPFRQILGPHFLHITNQNQLTGRFNNHLKDALMVFADEAFWAGDKAAEGVLKGMITEPYVMVEPKGKDAFAVKNHLRLVIASNESWVIPAGLEERRFLVLDISDKYQQDTDHFGTIHNQLNNGGTEALLHELLNRKITSNLRKAPKTEGLLNQIEHSMDSVTRFWYGRLEEGSLRPNHADWEHEIVTQSLYADYIEFCRTLNVRHPVANNIFTKKLKRLCLIHNGRETTGQRKPTLQFGTLRQCRQDFERIVGMNVSWND